MDSKAECGQLNLAHVARNKKIKETETNARLVKLPSEKTVLRIASVIKNVFQWCSFHVRL